MSRKEKVLHSTMLVTLVIILSKAIGFGRDMVTTAYFGRTMENDAYVSAYSLFYLPVLLFNSCISATLIPMYVSERSKYTLKHSNRFASNAINLFALLALIVSAVMFALAEPLVKLVYHGFPAEKIALTAELTRIMVLALVFNVASIAVSNMLNAMEKYIAAQLTGFPLSLCVIVASVAFSGRFGIRAVAWGVFAANILQLLILIPFLKGWFHYTPELNLRDERFKTLAKLSLPAMLSMGVSELNHMIDHALAIRSSGGHADLDDKRIPADYILAGYPDRTTDDDHVLENEREGCRKQRTRRAEDVQKERDDASDVRSADRRYRRGAERGCNQVRVYARQIYA